MATVIQSLIKEKNSKQMLPKNNRSNKKINARIKRRTPAIWRYKNATVWIEDSARGKNCSYKEAMERHRRTNSTSEKTTKSKAMKKKLQRKSDIRTAEWIPAIGEHHKINSIKSERITTRCTESSLTLAPFSTRLNGSRIENPARSHRFTDINKQLAERRR